jgi:hypothetical protein
MDQRMVCVLCYIQEPLIAPRKAVTVHDGQAVCEEHLKERVGR